MATLLPEGKQSFQNSAGAPLVGGRLYTYDAGTNNPRATYQDSAATLPNTNPVVMDARGEATIFWSGAYKVELRDALNNLIWTVDNVVDAQLFTSAFITRLADNTTIPNGTGMVGYGANLTYLAGTVGRTLYNDPINPHDFPWLVKGDGVTNDSAAIQAVVNFANGRPILFEDRTYLLSASIELNMQAGSGTYRPGSKILGQGMSKTVFLNRSGGPAFKHTLTQAQGDTSSFARNVRLEGFDIVTDGSSPVGSRGIALQGAYFPVLSDLRIFGMLGNGIEALVDARWGNPDLYSNATIIVDRCVLTANSGWAIYQSAFSNTWRITETYTTANTGGGYRLLGSMQAILGGAVAGNGSAVDVNSGGIILARDVGSVQECDIVNCEIDSNYQRQVWFQGYNNRLRNSRIIDDATGGSFRCPKQVEIGGVAGETCDGNIIDQVLFRMSNIGAANTTNVYVNLPVTDGSQTARYNTVQGCLYSNSGATSGVVTNFAVQNSSNVNAVGNRYYKDGQLLFSSSALRSTDRSCASIAFGGNYPPPVSPASATVISANSITYDTHGAYNNVAYEYTAPYSGLLRIEVNFLISGGAANVGITIFAQQDNGGGYSTLGPTLSIRDGNAGTFKGHFDIVATAGYKYRLLAVQAVGGTAQVAASSGSSLISYSMQ